MLHDFLMFIVYMQAIYNLEMIDYVRCGERLEVLGIRVEC